MIKDKMTENHRYCDEDFGEVESLVSQKKFQEAEVLFLKWKDINLKHFRIEEEFLFPKTEEAIGQKIPPIFVMLAEHQQIKALISEMEEALKVSDANRFLGNSETCMIMIQQHNMKEEQILYPIIERSLEAFDPDLKNSLVEMLA